MLSGGYAGISILAVGCVVIVLDNYFVKKKTEREGERQTDRQTDRQR